MDKRMKKKNIQKNQTMIKVQSFRKDSFFILKIRIFLIDR